MPTLTIIRGLPGSGKTTLARRLGQVCYEADMFFMDDNGDYNYNKEHIHDAHDWCQRKVYEMLYAKMDCTVCNTFIRRFHLNIYIEMAKELGCNVQIYICKGEFQNTHNVPQEVIERMRNEWED